MTEKTALGPIYKEVGGIITITLEENISTGFTVCLTELPEFLALVADEQFPGVHPVGIAGLSGTRRFTFVAVKEGEGELRFNEIKFTHPDLTIKNSTALEHRFVKVTA